MNLINLLCVGRPKGNVIDVLYLLCLPSITMIFLIYGIKNICENVGKKEEYSKNKFKRGVFSFLIFLALSVVSLVILSANSNKVRDVCDNYSHLYRGLIAIFNIVRVIVPIIFFVKFISLIINWLATPIEKRTSKKEVCKNVFRYIVITILIFFIVTIYSAFTGIVTKTTSSSDENNSVSWATCWCSD